MTEFVSATTAFVMAWSVYQVFQSVRETRKATSSSPVVHTIPVAAAAPVSTKPAVPERMPDPPPVPATRRKASAPAGSPVGTQVRDPVSGEVINMPTNYRFAKKWIKAALVTEGLLDRVYKPNELDEVATQKTRNALERFRSLPKYQA